MGEGQVQVDPVDVIQMKNYFVKLLDLSESQALQIMAIYQRDAGLVYSLSVAVGNGGLDAYMFLSYEMDFADEGCGLVSGKLDARYALEDRILSFGHEQGKGIDSLAEVCAFFNRRLLVEYAEEEPLDELFRCAEIWNGRGCYEQTLESVN
ncbi:MAG: hypothetical protein H6500_00510 [Candidatus Woesearchaeota archaeon]|nr:hypothetical protein [Nanoarchaeota archaeon]USN44314.1 MAG: hypothetical protein H6500_00510 [Candidatus Woesearchaeota archaeon]